MSVAPTRQMMWRMLGAAGPMEAHRIDGRGVAAGGASTDAAEGMASLLEKRPARFPDRVGADMPGFFPWWGGRGGERGRRGARRCRRGQPSPGGAPPCGVACVADPCSCAVMKVGAASGGGIGVERKEPVPPPRPTGAGRPDRAQGATCPFD